MHRDKERQVGKTGRPVTTARWNGANHFVRVGPYSKRSTYMFDTINNGRTDHPERVLLGLLEDDVEDWTASSS